MVVILSVYLCVGFTEYDSGLCTPLTIPATCHCDHCLSIELCPGLPTLVLFSGDYSCLLTILNKALQMDSNVSDSVLQKTSPPQDPAALDQVVTEVTRQASLLTVHHQQLDRLTTMTEELVRSMRSLTQAVQQDPTASNPL